MCVCVGGDGREPGSGWSKGLGRLGGGRGGSCWVVRGDPVVPPKTSLFSSELLAVPEFRRLLWVGGGLGLVGVVSPGSFGFMCAGVGSSKLLLIVADLS